MFGEGNYFADDGSKADQYTKNADTRVHTGSSPLAAIHKLLYPDGVLPASGVNYIFLCRVGLGCTIRTKDGHTCMDPGVATGNRLFATNKRRQLGEIVNCTEPKVPYHSLLVELGGKIARFREVVVFDGARIYPEYLLAYSRVRDSGEPEPEPAV